MKSCELVDCEFSLAGTSVRGLTVCILSIPRCCYCVDDRTPVAGIWAVSVRLSHSLSVSLSLCWNARRVDRVTELCARDHSPTHSRWLKLRFEKLISI